MAKKDEDEVRTVKTNPTDPASVQPGDILSITYYTRVVGNHRYSQTLEVVDLDRNTPFRITGDELIKAAYTADRFTEEVKLPRTEICEILTERCWGVPFTVCFDKENGEERTLRCRYLAWEKMDGRSQVEKLDPEPGERPFKQVNHRTVKWLILRGVKYISNSRPRKKD